MGEVKEREDTLSDSFSHFVLLSFLLSVTCSFFLIFLLFEWWVAFMDGGVGWQLCGADGS